MGTTSYLWDVHTDNVLSEDFDDSTPVAVYTYGDGTFGELISRQHEGNACYYHTDISGSTRALSDDSEAVTDTYDYDAWGGILERQGNTPNPFCFGGTLGYYSDEHVAGIYVRRRWYSPDLARWTSCDPVGIADGPNQYVYVHNHPIGESDPSGLFCGSPCEGKSREEICDPEFLKDFDVRMTGGGGVICCDGVAYGCLFPPPKGSGLPPVGECKALDECAQKHEDGHAATTKCDPKRSGPYRASFSEEQKKKGLHISTECRHRADQVKCLCGKLRADKGGKDRCKRAMIKMIYIQLNDVNQKDENNKHKCSKGIRKGVYNVIKRGCTPK